MFTFWEKNTEVIEKDNNNKTTNALFKYKSTHIKKTT